MLHNLLQQICAEGSPGDAHLSVRVQNVVISPNADWVRVGGSGQLKGSGLLWCTVQLWLVFRCIVVQAIELLQWEK